MIYLTSDRTSVKPNCKKKIFYMSNILCDYGKSQKKDGKGHKTAQAVNIFVFPCN
jgi:hypothetical protein